MKALGLVIFCCLGLSGCGQSHSEDEARKPKPEPMSRADLNEKIRASYADPANGAFNVEKAIRLRVGASDGFFRLKAWGDEEATVSIPITAPFALICDTSGLWISIEGAAYEHQWVRDDNGQDVDAGATSGVRLTYGAFTPDDCTKRIMPAAENAMTAVIKAGRPGASGPAVLSAAP